MKTSSTSLLKVSAIALFGATLLLSSACTKTRDAGTTTTTTTTSAAGTTASANDTWNTIRAYSYDQRAEFANRTNEVAARLERDSTSAQGAAANRLAEARDELRTAASEISNATAATWDATKERVGRAMQKAESAYENVAE